MSHSYTKIWIHAVYGTKLFAPLISESFEKELFDHIKHHLSEDFDCPVKIINGAENHIHILFRLNPNSAIKDIMKNIKGESSHWVNQQNFSSTKFAWQTGYGAFSVSESMISEVEAYIRNQKIHHKKLSFIDEYNEFMQKHGLPILQKDDLE